jgi:hypothetical protein
MIVQRPSSNHIRDREIAAMPIAVEHPHPIGYWTRRIEYALTGMLIVVVTIWAVAR